MDTNARAQLVLLAHSAKLTSMSAPVRLVRTTGSVLTRQMVLSATASLPIREPIAKQVCLFYFILFFYFLFFFVICLLQEYRHTCKADTT